MKPVEAQFYTVNSDIVECTLCPHHCKLKNGQSGICKTRQAIDGKLFTLAYGNPCSLNIDPIEKKPLYHFYPASKSFSIATAGCNLGCLNCQNSSISQVSPAEISSYNLSPLEIVEQAVKYKASSISYTYTDPVVYYEYALECSKIARERNIKNVIVSAGYINEEPLRELCKYIDAANIDLKVFDNEVYRKLNKATLAPVLNTLKTLKENNIWLEITNLIIPQWTDNLDTIKRMCNWLLENGFDETPIHFSRFYPQNKLSNVSPTPVATLEKVFAIAKDSGLKYVYLGNVTGSNGENTYCHICNKLLVERNGYLIARNNIRNGACMFCGTLISGRFE